MQYELLISAIAFSETDDAYTYYESQSPGLGDGFLKSLDDIYYKLSHTPHYCSFINSAKDLRDIRVKKFPFVVIFQIVNDRVLVLRVFDSHRDPRSLKNL